MCAPQTLGFPYVEIHAMKLLFTAVCIASAAVNSPGHLGTLAPLSRHVDQAMYPTYETEMHWQIAAVCTFVIFTGTCSTWVVYTLRSKCHEQATLPLLLTLALTLL